MGNNIRRLLQTITTFDYDNYLTKITVYEQHLITYKEFHESISLKFKIKKCLKSEVKKQRKIYLFMQDQLKES